MGHCLKAIAVRPLARPAEGKAAREIKNLLTKAEKLIRRPIIGGPGTHRATALEGYPIEAGFDIGVISFSAIGAPDQAIIVGTVAKITL